MFLDVNNSRLGVTVRTSQTGIAELALIGDDDASWSAVIDMPPCSITLDCPPPPPPPFFHLLASANGFPVMPNFVFAGLDSSFTCTYEVIPKQDPPPCPAATVSLSGFLSGFQRIAGLLGVAVSDVHATVSIQPFRQFSLWDPATAPARGLIRESGRNVSVARLVRVPFSDTAQVPWKVPQNIEIQMTAYANAMFAISSTAQVTRLRFRLAAPDPPGQGTIKIRAATVRRQPRSLPAPRTVGAMRIREIPIPRDVFISAMTTAGNTLMLAGVRSNTGKAVLLQLGPRSGRVGPAVVTNLALITGLAGARTGSGHEVLYAISLSAQDLATGVPPEGSATIARFTPKGRATRVAAGLSHPSAITQAPPERGATLIFSDFEMGTLNTLDNSGAVDLVLEGLDAPIALAAPPSGEGRPGFVYVAEAGLDRGAKWPVSGQVRQVSMDDRSASVLVSGIGATGLAFSPGGVLTPGLYASIAGDISGDGSATTQEPGQIARISNRGEVSPVVVSVDQPRGISFTDSGRCFFLAGSKLFEIVPAKGDS